MKSSWSAAIERRPPRVRAGFTGAAEEVQAVVFGVDARLFLRAVPDAEVHALMRAFGDGDSRRHDVGLLVDVERLDVDELKQRHAVQPPLHVLHAAAAIEIAFLERHLPQDRRGR